MLLLCVLSFTAAAKPAVPPVILVLGDSLSAGYGLPRDAGWVSLLERRLATQGYPHRVVNASISGDTSAGGLSRLPAALEAHRPQIVLVELGGNDGLRAQPVKQLRSNLERIVALSRAAGATPVLFEMQIPSNYGPAYTDSFAKVFGETAKTLKTPLVPFFLAAIATDPAQFQDDGIHPSAAAQPKLLDGVWPTLKPLLKP